jgi:hypothetical protein
VSIPDPDTGYLSKLLRLSMNIIFYYTSQLTDIHWETYTNSFNHVFKRNYTPAYFKKKYKNTEESYHGFIVDKGRVVGGCTAMPQNYNFYGTKMKFALLVDVFVHENYRKYETAMYDAYQVVISKLSENSFRFIFGVPNDISLSFWKSAAGWKEIGILPWYVLPVRLGNILNKAKIFNLSSVFIYFYSFVIFLVSYLFRYNKRNNISLIADTNFFLQRLSWNDYDKVPELPVHYVITSENNVQTAFILSESTISFNRLSKTILHILFKKKVDLIVFVGNINCFQLALIKIPNSLHPRNLHLCGKDIDEKINKDIYCIRKWDFGLLNFDVR